LKEDKRVIVLDNTNAIHISLPEKMDFISIDVGWTPQQKILPNAIKNLKPDGKIISLIKPHYESGKNLSEKSDEELNKILEKIKDEIKNIVEILEIIESPIVGKKAGNKEFLMLCKKN